VNGVHPATEVMHGRTAKLPKMLKKNKNGEIKTEIVIPAVLDRKSKRQGSPISAKTGLPVQVFVCPACRFVELYYSARAS
jgi:hypothetical protein